MGSRGWLFLFITILSSSLFTCRPESTKPSKDRILPTKLPGLRVSDISGRTYSLKRDFRDTPILILFLDPDVESNMVILERVLNDLSGLKVAVVVSADKIETVLSQQFASALYFLAGPYDKILRKFGAPRYQSSFYIFSNKGNLLYRGLIGNRYETHLKKFINHYIKNIKFEVHELLPPGHSLKGDLEFKNIECIAGSTKRYFLGALFINFCDSCLGGQILALFKEILDKYPDHISCFMVLKDRMNGQDLRNLVTQANIPFPVLFAPPELRARWDMLATRYSESELNELTVMLDSRGVILRSWGPEMQQISELRAFINSVLERER